MNKTLRINKLKTKKDMNAKISVFVICVEAINLHDSTFNTLTTNCEYSRSNRKNLPLPIQRQLSIKLNNFS